MLVCTLLDDLRNSYTEINHVLTFSAMVHFVNLVVCLRPVILLHEHSTLVGPPEELPDHVYEFLEDVLHLDLDAKSDKEQRRTENVRKVYRLLGRLAWKHSEEHPNHHESLASQYIPIFLEHGQKHDLAFYSFVPPTKQCYHCKSESGRFLRELSEVRSFEVVVITAGYGSIVGRNYSLYCRHCCTRYHHDYYIHDNASKRTYYLKEDIQWVQSAKHQYVSAEQCEKWSNMMLCWNSANTCAKIYNSTMQFSSFHESLPLITTKKLEIDGEEVWNTLFLYWLYRDALERNDPLVLDHKAHSQALRLRPALLARNKRMVGTGQEHWNHACDYCCHFIEQDGEQCIMRSVVTDGVTIGRPCCSVHDCKEDLASVKDRFCPKHYTLNEVCVVTNCNNKAELRHQTCSIPEHRKFEHWNNLRNRAMFQLQQRLTRTRGATSHDGQDAPDPEDDEIEEGGRICDSKPEAGNTKLRARFGRRRTHNDQLCVYSCGIIASRATFFGSEAVNSVRQFLMRTFPTKNSLPQVIWHDNNCQMKKMLNNDTDLHLKHYFDGCALPVDVFHFKSKHKESDKFCSEHCNPASWPQLITEDKKWRFNSSAAEQANGWIGHYHAILREMEAVRYDFFLDEMIKRRNRQLVEKLGHDKRHPWSLPRKYLLR